MHPDAVLYQPVGALTTTDQAVQTETGRAYKTLTSMLANTTYDASGTTGLALPSNARGAQFRKAEGGRILVLWAIPTAGSEIATTDIDIASSRGFVLHEWDSATTTQTTTINAANGTARLSLVGTPRIFIEQ